MPTDGGPLILPHGGIFKGRADTGFGTGYSFNLGSFQGVYDDVAPHDYAEAAQVVDLTNVDVITFRLGLRGAAAGARPSNLVALGHFDGSPTFTAGDWDLAYCRDGGSVTGTAVGSPVIFGTGKFGPCVVFNAAEYIYWSGANIVDSIADKFTIELWIRPDYSGTPSAHQYFYALSNSSSSVNNLVTLAHMASGPYVGNLRALVYSSMGSGIVDINAGSFSPTSGNWYHTSFNVNTDDGASRLFLDGGQHDATDTSTGTRTAAMEYMVLADNGFGGGSVNAFAADELQVYDAVQRTADFDVPEAALPENYWLFRVLIGSSLVHEEKIYPLADTEFPQRAINVAPFTGSQTVRLRLVAV